MDKIFFNIRKYAPDVKLRCNLNAIIPVIVSIVYEMLNLWEYDTVTGGGYDVAYVKFYFHVVKL